MITYQHNLDEFSKTLGQYVALRKRELHGDVVAKARDLSFRLAGYSGRKYDNVRQGAFGQPHQADVSDIEAAIALRGFPAGRKGDALTKRAKYGVSEYALKLATSMMEGQKSQAFKVTQFGIYPARFGKTGNRKGKLLFAGKFGGEKWRKRGVGFSSLTPERQAQARAAGGFKTLNIVAVAKGIEGALRKKAARGGTMAAQWLPKAWRKRMPAMPGMAFDESNQHGSTLGRVLVGKESVTLQAMVPGTEKYPGRVSEALVAAIADMREYIAKKWAKIGRQ